MDQIMLFGDSITQQSFSPENYFGAALNNAYVRKLDIVNRGFSGYNTTQALKVLPRFMPTPSQARVRFLLVFLGANDARLPDTLPGPQQHVPIETFRENLRAIVMHPCVQAHQGIRIILVTPPPIDERKCLQLYFEQYGGHLLRRTAKTTELYSQTVRDLAKELKLPVLDIWTAMMRRAGLSEDYTLNSLKDREAELPGSQHLPSNPVLQDYLHDGLHFTRSAYELLYDELMALIQRRWPEQSPERLRFTFPAWDDEQAWAEDEQVSTGTRL